MPPARSCNKCKTATAAEGDTWCVGCTSWEFIGRELCGSWDSSGARLLASDLVVNTARQIRALRSLSAGLARVAPTAPVAGEGRARAGTEERSDQVVRESLPRRRSSIPPPPAASAKEEDQSEVEDEEEESEEEIPDAEHRSLGGGHHRPPEPEGPTSGRERREHRDKERSSGTGDHHRGRDRERSRRRRQNSNRRGGRKHPRLNRLASNPQLLVHRKPGSDFWELQSGRRDVLKSERLGR